MPKFEYNVGDERKIQQFERDIKKMRKDLDKTFAVPKEKPKNNRMLLIISISAALAAIVLLIILILILI